MISKIGKGLKTLITNGAYFRRLCLLVALVSASIMLLQNISFGYNKKIGPWFTFSPAAEIKISFERCK